MDGIGYCPAGQTARLGRGGATAIAWPDGRSCYYREFRHGGLLARMLGTRYLSRQPLEREIENSRLLDLKGLLVPAPVLGRVERRGLFVGLALVTERIPGQTLLEALDAGTEKPLRPLLERVGRVVARMHEIGFRHRDMHPGNILVRADGEIVLIDLVDGRWGGRKGDRASIKSLVRMGRYLEKHGYLDRPPSATHVLTLLRGYEPDAQKRKELFRRLRSSYRRELLWRRFFWFLGSKLSS